MSAAERLDALASRFLRRLLVDALIEQTREYWLKRAETFEAARTMPGDWTGHATAEQLAEHDRRLAEIAQACRNAAALCLHEDTRAAIEALYDDAFADAA